MALCHTVGSWQKNIGYIPCRILKNISYGHMGITNSPRVYELFENKVVYHPDCYQLFLEAHKRITATTTREEMVDLINL